jgi:hypothetical protein
MELGMGAGWAKDEYDAVGVFDAGPVPEPRGRAAAICADAGGSGIHCVDRWSLGLVLNGSPESWSDQL